MSDLQRYLRQDDSKNFVFKYLSSQNIVQSILQPLIVHCQNKKSLRISATKLIVMLTMPAEKELSDTISQHVGLKSKPSSALDFLQKNYVNYLQKLKSSFLSARFMAPFTLELTNAWAPFDGSDRDNNDSRVIGLGLTLFRNLLHVPDALPNLLVPAQYTHLKEDFMKTLESEHILELVLHFIQHVNEDNSNSWQLLLLEIVYLLVREHNPASLLACPSPGKDEKLEEKKDEKKSDLAAESEQKTALLEQHLNDAISSGGSATTYVKSDKARVLLKGFVEEFLRVGYGTKISSVLLLLCVESFM